jgi:hypothetical protein
MLPLFPMQAFAGAITLTWDTVGLPFLLSLLASIVAVLLLWAKDQWRLASHTSKYCGDWEQFVPDPSGLVRDPQNCTVAITRPSRWKPDVLRLRAKHNLKGHEYVWEGNLVIDRNLYTRGVIAWAYTAPRGVPDFGVYNVLLHDNGEVFMTPALPPLGNEHRRLVLRRSQA